MLGTRGGIWHDGWFANTVHAASPSGWSHFDQDRWELFHIEADRSQCHDLAGEQPEKLEELKALWFAEAAKYNGLPLADLGMIETLSGWRPYLSEGRQTFTYYPGTAEVGIGAAVELRVSPSRCWLRSPSRTPTRRGGVGQAGRRSRGGHVLFVQDGKLQYVYNFMGGEDEQRVIAADRIPLGSHVFGVSYTRTGTVEGGHTPPLGEVTLFVDEQTVATRAAVRTHPGMFGLAGGGSGRGPQPRPSCVDRVSGAVPLYGRHDRQGGNRRIGYALPGRGTGTGAGVLQGLTPGLP